MKLLKSIIFSAFAFLALQAVQLQTCWLTDTFKKATPVQHAIRETLRHKPFQPPNAKSAMATMKH